MSKHTPGPWSLEDWAVYDEHGALNTCGAQVVDAEGHMVSACTVEGATDAEEANARLIAAAPELLEALQLLMAASGEQLSSAFEAAQAAIAKATGEQQ